MTIESHCHAVMVYVAYVHPVRVSPMRIAYLDCFSGISGDMFLGALLDAGVPFELFEKTVAALNIGASWSSSRVDRGGISATKLDVVVGGEEETCRAWRRALCGACHGHTHGPRTR